MLPLGDFCPGEGGSAHRAVTRGSDHSGRACSCGDGSRHVALINVPGAGGQFCVSVSTLPQTRRGSRGAGVVLGVGESSTVWNAVALRRKMLQTAALRRGALAMDVLVLARYGD